MEREERSWRGKDGGLGREKDLGKEALGAVEDAFFHLRGHVGASAAENLRMMVRGRQGESEERRWRRSWR